MKRKMWGLSFVVTAVLTLASYNVEAETIKGTGTLSGTVAAPRAFQAAQMYALNVDKNILYMVYTSNGRYRAMHLFPGNYEVRVEKKGLESDVKKIVVKAGENTTADFSLREVDPSAKDARTGLGSRGGGADRAQLVSYDVLYPPGPGRDAIEKNCGFCHGPDYFPRYHMSEQEWRKKGLSSQLNISGTGRRASPPLISPVTVGVHPRGEAIIAMKDTLNERDTNLIAKYLADNFGPSSPRRALKNDAEIPVDENALANAMYIEYYLPLDPKLDVAGAKRTPHDPHIGTDGNVWYTDTSIPNRIGRVDPRNGEFKDYKTPATGQAQPHGLTVDEKGDVWWVDEFSLNLGHLDPRTGKIVYYDANADGSVTNGMINTPALDSQQNVWFTFLLGNKLGKWERKTEKIVLYDGPTKGQPGYGYGIVVDKSDKVWFAEYQRCRVAKFDPAIERFTEYPALPGPDPQCQVRRVGLDSKGMIWYDAWFGAPSRGKLGKIDPRNGEQVIYDIPLAWAGPYGMGVDPDDNVWAGDGGLGDRGTFIKFDQKTKKFTYFPTPQIASYPNIDITREGAIWYTTRTEGNTAVGVLYPDATRITSLAAYH